MPREVESCVRQVKAKGKSTKSAWRICRSSLGSDAEIKARRKGNEPGHMKHMRDHGLHK